MNALASNIHEDIVSELASYSKNPYGFVMFAFPWGEEGTDLEDSSGPEPWQEDLLRTLGNKLLTVGEVIRFATCSGHGVGKSALVAWLILWAMSTFEDTKGVVTANTENQLKTKTWAELAKWYRNFIARDMFKLTATALFSADPDHERTWRVDMTPWSERNTEAFAGLHNKGKRLIIIFDEGSAIPDLISEVTEGALTDKQTEIIWAKFGNPTRNTGRFRECFGSGRFAHRWHQFKVDSREVAFTNKEQIADWIQDYGDDSDFVRIRVKGEFPRVDATSFIPFDLAREASLRQPYITSSEPIVLGVDVGRFGDDPSVIYPRQGRDASTLPVEIYPQIDTMTLARKVAEAALRYHCQFVFVDGGGVGGGVIDRLNQLNISVIDVQFGGKPDGASSLERGVKYGNKRAEIWGAMRTWLETGSIHENLKGTSGDFTLVDELCAPTYELNKQEQIILENKQTMRRAGKPNPNIADALACTFAYTTYIPERGQLDVFGQTLKVPTLIADYDPYTLENIYGLS